MKADAPCGPGVSQKHHRDYFRHFLMLNNTKQVTANKSMNFVFFFIKVDEIVCYFLKLYTLSRLVHLP